MLEVDHSTLGPIKLPGRRCGSTTTRTPAAHRAPPPLALGEHNESVRRLARRDGRHHRRGPGVSPGRRLGARELLDTVLDAGSWQSWDAPPQQVAEPDSAVRRRAGGRPREGRHGRVGDHRRRAHAGAAGSRSSSASSASSPGRSAHAASERLVAPSSGPPARACRCSPPRRPAAPACRRARPAFLGMVKIAAAVAAHKAAGLPYLVYLRHPTTGGVFASWGSLGHVTVAEPGALVGFLGPAGLRGAVRRAVPRRACRPREPLRPRADRRGDPDRGPGASVAAPGPQRADGRARGAARGPELPREEPAGPARPGSRSPAPGDPSGPGCGRCCRPAAPPTSCPCTAPARASRTRAC